ncbi:MAG TPA: response regulator transcription factor [Pseudolabrys sp.]|nr:response regulator transcription factor [Pseudolabrys sp.]
MSQVSPNCVAIIDAKDLRRASITSLLQPWANTENLELASFTPDQAIEALHADSTFRILICSIGGDSLADGTLDQLKVLRELANDVPLVIISDKDDVRDVIAAFSIEVKGFIHSGIPFALANHALSFILNGGSYFPPSAVHQLRVRSVQSGVPQEVRASDSDAESKQDEQSTSDAGDSGSARAGKHQTFEWVRLTVRQRQVLEHIRLGESNKVIARRLGMTEGTVKVHIRQMMRKCRVSNRTQLALGGNPSAEAVE